MGGGVSIPSENISVEYLTDQLVALGEISHCQDEFDQYSELLRHNAEAFLALFEKDFITKSMTADFLTDIGISNAAHRDTISTALANISCRHKYVQQCDDHFTCVDCDLIITEDERISKERAILADIASDSNSESIEYGVTIKWIHQFANEHSLWDKPTWQVRREFILPATEGTRCRFVELSDVTKNNCVGRAVTYVSHSWQAPFGDLVGGLVEAADHNRIVYVDIFCANQWFPSCHYANMFPDLIRACSSFMLICSSSAFTESPNNVTATPLSQETTSATTSLSCSCREEGETYGHAPISVLALSSSRSFALTRLWCLAELHVACLDESKAIIIKCGQHAFQKKNNYPYLIPDSAIVLDLSHRIDVASVFASKDIDDTALRMCMRKHHLQYVRESSARSEESINTVLGRAISRALPCMDSPTIQAAACGDDMAGFHIATNAFDVLVAATISGYLRAIGVIIAEGHDLRHAKTEHSKDHALIEAANNDRLMCMELLLTGGLPVDATNRGGATALMSATAAEHVRCMEVLLKYGADINHRDSEGFNALMMAALHDKYDSFQYLIGRGADPLDVNDKGVTVLMCAMSGAVMSGDLRCVQYIVDKSNGRSQMNAQDDFGNCCVLIASCSLQCLQYAIAMGGDVNVCLCEDGTTPLINAVREGEVECVKLIIESGCDLLVKDAMNRTPLMIAKRSKSSPQKSECIRLISEALNNGQTTMK